MAALATASVDLYLGTHYVSWLGELDVPLFVSAIRLRRFKLENLPRARGRWALDSGGFTELSTHGRWTVSPEQYVAEVRAWSKRIGGLEWAAAQDWMCEPEILRKTGLTVEEHQRRTVANYLRLVELAPELPWVPVLQGWTAGDYDRCARMYEEAGVDLAALPRVGIGSVCRRQNTTRAVCTIQDFARRGIRLHGFGFKLGGLQADASLGGGLASADSLAWSFQARKNRPLDGCAHKSCANCPRYALEWRADCLEKVARARRESPFCGTANNPEEV